MRVRAKICGITSRADADAAVGAGCDALGFNFFPQSPRYIAPERVRSIVATLPPFVTAVGLFVDAEPRHVRDVAVASGIGLVQFHGEESDAACAAVGLPYIKVFNKNISNILSPLKKF